MNSNLNMPREAINVGQRVFLWARPDETLVLLLAEGAYAGNDFTTGRALPVVKLDDGREIVVTHSGIAVGRAEVVAKTVQGLHDTHDIMQWSIDDYLRGKLPDPARRTKTPAGATAPQLPAPKSMSDRVLNLKKEIEYQEGKKKLWQKQIDEADNLIKTKRAEIRTLRDAVMKELSELGLNDDFPVTTKVDPVVVTEVPTTVAQPFINDVTTVFTNQAATDFDDAVRALNDD